jgi:phosphatidylserine decarboxylase
MIKSHIQKTRIENRLPVAREGLPFIIPGLIATLLLFFFGVIYVGTFVGLLTLFTIYFFRDPDRTGYGGKGSVLSPADGRIIDIRQLEGSDNWMGAPAVKVSIFMNVFNVHVNRIPFKGKISKIKYHPGKFVNASLDKASEHNERNGIELDTDNGQRIVFVQIAGLIARRIVWWIKEGDEVEAGQRFGLIRFGSRVDVYLPVESSVSVRLQEKVKAGKTVIGYLP